MAEKKYRIGIDLGGTNIKVGLVDDENRLVAKKSAKTGASRHYTEVVADIAATTNALLAQQGIGIDEVLKIGVGSPGLIDHANGVVAFASNFGWNDVPLLAELARYFDKPMRLSNDANVAALGETIAGAAKGARHVVMLTLGTGVGGGVVVDKRVQEGGNAGGMELGHATIQVDGALCTCGHRGCIEAYASATGLARMAREAAQANPQSLLWEMCAGDLTRMNGAIPFKAARKGDASAQGVVDMYIKYLGEACINIVNVWRPEKILLGGGISNEGAPLLNPLNAYVRAGCFAGEKGYIAPIEVAALGNDAGIIGAAAL